MQAAQSCALWRATSPAFGGSPGRRGEPSHGAGRSGEAACIQERSERQSPLARGKGGGRKQWHGQSAAVPVLTAVPPGGPERRLAAQREAGAVRRRRCISRRTDRSADRCADWHTEATACARATAASHTAPPGGWQLRTRRGLLGGDTVSATAQTGPPTTALTARLPPTRPARQRSRAGAACPAWKGRRALWYPYAYTAGRGASGPCGVRGA